LIVIRWPKFGCHRLIAAFASVTIESISASWLIDDLAAKMVKGITDYVKRLLDRFG
jgi:hypothetical protein